ncbi:MAG: hypothetical protein K0Q50_2115 [Vampirovibrio sp.]|jgi:hypothetical protein|nr:hypothetical protein [Vampirovibrio sp.]
MINPALKQSAWLLYGLSTVLAFSIGLSPAFAQADSKASAAQSAPSASYKEPLTSKQPAALAADKSEKPKKRAARKEQKREMKAELEALPVLAEIQKLQWEEASLNGQSNDTKRIGLEKIFGETLDHSIAVKQAEVQIKDAEAQAKEIRDPNLFNLLNPLDVPALKKAAESNVLAAKAHLQAVRQKALLDSAKMYADLTQAFLGKYLAFQSIEQGRSQLKAEQEKFIAGENNRFDVTETQMVLIERYGKYLNADNLYRTASLALANQISASADTTLVPESVELQEGQAVVSPLKLLPDELSLGAVLRSAKTRPDMQEMNHRRDALEKLAKAASGVDKQKKKAELHQLELEIEKAANGVSVMAEKAYGDYLVARKSLVLAQQNYELGNQFVYQLHVSYSAGFSSSKDLLDAQIEMAKVKTGLIGAQVAYNLSQIQVLYEMGLLTADIFSRPIAVPSNLL